MKQNIKPVMLAMVALILNACAASVADFTINTEKTEVGPAPADKAQIVFLRVSFVAGAYPADIFEIEDGDLSYVGKVRMSRKLAHLTTPGKKVYMGHGAAADFMYAEVEAGKTYYVLIRPNWGSGAMIPTPIKRDGTTAYNTDSPEFQKWLDKTRVTEMKSAEADAWMSTNKAKFEEIYKRYWAKFETKSADQKRTRTLMLSDGE